MLEPVCIWPHNSHLKLSPIISSVTYSRSITGRVTFAVLDRGVPVPQARERQDAFVRALVADAGGRALAYRPDPVPAMTAATLAVGR